MQLPFKLSLHVFFFCRCLYTFISGFPYTPIIVLITFMACDSDMDDLFMKVIRVIVAGHTYG